MSRHPFLAFALIPLAAAVPAQAQTAPDLVAKNLEARGGAVALDAITNISFAGRAIFPGDIEVDYREWRAREGASTAGRTDLTLQGLSLVQAFDGSGAWRINPFQGRKDAERMTADEARSLADSALIQGPLLASRTDGSRVEYLGREDFDGTLAYKLKVSQKDGDEFVYWLDPDTYLEIKVAESRKIRGAPQTTEYELGDYEKVAGVYFPMSVESWQQGQADQKFQAMIATAKANGAVPAAVFAEPKAGAAPTAATAGEDASDAARSAKPPGESDAPGSEPGKGGVQ
jgi:hypothetical protein